MGTNIGIEIEKRIINELFGKRVKELSPFWQGMIKKMFTNVQDRSVVIARHVPAYMGCKTDIEIKLERELKLISVKSGACPHIHQEKIVYFLDFLKEEGISEKTRNFVAYYLFADGSIDGTGNKFLKAKDIEIKYNDAFKEANKELSNEEFARKLLYRCVIKGRKETRKEIDYVYYGDENHGYLISKEEILNICSKKDTSHYNCLHGGVLMLRRKSRIDRHDETKRDNRYLQLRWPSLVYDFDRIAREQIYNTQ